MKYVDYTKMTEDEFEAAMRWQAFWCQADMGFWRKLMVVLWLALLVWMTLEIAGVVLVVSPNAFWAGVFGVVGMPIVGIVDYYQFQKDWR